MIEQAIQRKVIKNQNPYPDKALQHEMDLRAVKKPSAVVQPLPGETPSISAANAALSRVHDAWERIEQAAANKSTPFKDLHVHGSRHVSNAEKSVDSATKTIQGQIDHYNKEIDEVIMPKTVSPNMAAEIRMMVRQKPSAALDLVRQDPRFSAAILNGPAALSGLSKEQYETVRDMATRTFASELHAKREHAQKTLNQLQSRASEALSYLNPKLSTWRQQENPALERLKQ